MVHVVIPLIVFSLFLSTRNSSLERMVLDSGQEITILSQDTIVKRNKTIFPKDQWEVATPESQGVDATKLKEAIQYLEENSGFDGVKEVMIIRNGYLIWEGEEVDNVHGVWSVTKSFTGTVLGLLIDDGKASLNTLAGYIVPDMAVNYPNLLLKHYLTMTSGYRAQGDEPKGNYTHGPSATPFVPDEPLFVPPGSKYAYWDSAMNQFAYVLTRIANEPLEILLKRRILDPIGVNPEQWKWGDFGEFEGYKVNGGAGNNGNHISISAREIARFGHLFLNKGNWEGNQLISKEWVEKASSVQVPNTIPLGHFESGLTGSGVYGFNWWVNGIQSNGKRKWPNAPLGTFAAWGHNNNNMFIIPEWNMVIVRLGLDQGDKEITDEINNEFLKKIGKSIRE